MTTTPLLLIKGENIPLSKVTTPGSSNTIWLAGLGWEMRANAGAAFDLDASVFLLDANGKITKGTDFVYFGNLTHPTGAVVHSGDNLTGAGDGDDEIVTIDTSKVPAEIVKIVILINIYEAKARGQNFGQVAKATVNLYEGDVAHKVATFDLSEDASTDTALHFCEFYRNPSASTEWKFKSTGNGITAPLADIVASFGG